MRHIPADTTSHTIYIFIQDSSSTTGAGLTGLVYNSGSLTAYYVRSLGSSTAITLATLAAVTTAWSSGGFKEIDSTNQPGVYRLDVPDAVLATGANEAVIYLRGAANMVPCPIGIQLLAVPSDIRLINGATATVLADVYQASILPIRDVTNTQDEWSVVWLKNGVPVTTAITSPTIQVVKRADGTDLIASTALTQVGSTKTYKYTASGSERITIGEGYTATVTATIDAGSRTFSWPVGRDATT